MSSQTKYTFDETCRQFISEVDSSLYEEEPKWGEMIPYKPPVAYGVTDCQSSASSRHLSRDQQFDQYCELAHFHPAYSEQHTPAYSTNYYQDDPSGYYRNLQSQTASEYRHYPPHYPPMPYGHYITDPDSLSQTYPQDIQHGSPQYNPSYDTQYYNNQQSFRPYPPDQFYKDQIPNSSIGYFQNGYFHYTGQANQFHYRGTVYYNVHSQSCGFQENTQSIKQKIQDDPNNSQYLNRHAHVHNVSPSLEAYSQGPDTKKNNILHWQPKVPQTPQGASEETQKVSTSTKDSATDDENDIADIMKMTNFLGKPTTEMSETVESRAENSGMEDNTTASVTVTNLEEEMKTYEQSIPYKKEEEKLLQPNAGKGDINCMGKGKHTSASDQAFVDESSTSKQIGIIQESIKTVRDFIKDKEEMLKCGEAIVPFMDSFVVHNQRREMRAKEIHDLELFARLLSFVPSQKEWYCAYPRKDWLVLVPNAGVLGPYVKWVKEQFTRKQLIEIIAAIRRHPYLKEVFAFPPDGLLEIDHYVNVRGDCWRTYRKIKIEHAFKIIANIFHRWFFRGQMSIRKQNRLTVMPYVGGFHKYMQTNERVRNDFDIVATILKTLSLKRAMPKIDRQKKRQKGQWKTTSQDNVAKFLLSDMRLLPEKSFEEFQHSRRIEVHFDNADYAKSRRVVTLLNTDEDFIPTANMVNKSGLDTYVYLNAVKKYSKAVREKMICYVQEDVTLHSELNSVVELPDGRHEQTDKYESSGSKERDAEFMFDLSLVEAELEPDYLSENDDENYFIAMFGFH